MSFPVRLMKTSFYFSYFLSFMDVTELENLCRRLNTPLNPSEAQSAQRQLDTDGSGRVELFEFKNWWLGKIVFAEQSLNQKMTSVKNKGEQNLVRPLPNNRPFY